MLDIKSRSGHRYRRVKAKRCNEVGKSGNKANRRPGQERDKENLVKINHVVLLVQAVAPDFHGDRKVNGPFDDECDGGVNVDWGYQFPMKHRGYHSLPIHTMRVEIAKINSAWDLLRFIHLSKCNLFQLNSFHPKCCYSPPETNIGENSPRLREIESSTKNSFNKLRGFREPRIQITFYRN